MGPTLRGPIKLQCRHVAGNFGGISLKLKLVHCFIAWVGFLYNDPFVSFGVFDDFLQAGGPKASLKRHLFFRSLSPSFQAPCLESCQLDISDLGSHFFEGKEISVDKEAFWKWTFYFFWFPTKGGDVEAVYIYIHTRLYILYNVYIYIYVYTVYIYIYKFTHTHTYIYIYLHTQT